MNLTQSNGIFVAYDRFFLGTLKGPLIECIGHDGRIAKMTKHTDGILLQQGGAGNVAMPANAVPANAGPHRVTQVGDLAPAAIERRRGDSRGQEQAGPSYPAFHDGGQGSNQIPVHNHYRPW